MTINQLPELVSHDGTPAVPAVYNGADYKLPLGNIILTKTVSGTPNTSGNLDLGMHHDVAVLAVIRTGRTSRICTPLYNGSADTWIAHITTTGANPSAVTSGTESVLVFYLPCNFDYT